MEFFFLYQKNNNDRYRAAQLMIFNDFSPHCSMPIQREWRERDSLNELKANLMIPKVLKFYDVQ